MALVDDGDSGRFGRVGMISAISAIRTWGIVAGHGGSDGLASTPFDFRTRGCVGCALDFFSRRHTA